MDAAAKHRTRQLNKVRADLSLAKVARTPKDEIGRRIEQEDGYAIAALLELNQLHNQRPFFTKFDIHVLTDMAGQYSRNTYLSGKQINFMRSKIVRYTRHLNGHALEPLPIKQRTKPNNKEFKVASLESGQIIIRFQFPRGDPRFTETVNLIKDIPGREFEQAIPGWIVPVETDTILNLVKWNFKLSAELKKLASTTQKSQLTIGTDIILSNIPADLYDAITDELQMQNPKWVENAKMGRYNYDTPKKLLFYTETHNGLRIPRGYLSNLIDLCNNFDLKYKTDDQRNQPATRKFRFNGKLRPFQQEATTDILAHDFGTLCSATGSGKTVMALYIIAERKVPTLIVVHTKELAMQWTDRASKFLGINPSDIGMIGQGQMRVGKKITVAMVQTLYKCAEEVAPDIGFLVVDESHRCPSRTFVEAISKFDCQYMLGLTATPWRKDKLSRLIFLYVGDIRHEVDQDKLLDTGNILPVEAVIRSTEFSTRFDPVSEYVKMLSELTQDEERNQLIALDIADRIADKSNGICLVLSDRKAHCENLQLLLDQHGIEQVEVLTGETKKRRREIIVSKLNKGQVQVLIATGQLIGEGFDCEGLSTLFLTTPISFDGRVVQYLGRVLRPMPGKDKAVVYDYMDVNIDVLRRSARARQKIYERYQ